MCNLKFPIRFKIFHTTQLWTSRDMEKILFTIFAACGIVCFLFALQYARKYSTYLAFLVPPFTCVFITIDNLLMAMYDKIDDNHVAVDIILVAHALILPTILIICFEVAYLVHKKRSVNFCGLTFDSGHRAGRKEFCSNVLRFSIWVIALTLFMMTIIINFQWSGESENSLYFGYATNATHFICTVVPPIVLVVFSFYIGAQMWKYGTHYSFMVHATYFNPWIWMVIGSISLAIGNAMPPDIYHITTNAGEILMMICIMRMFREIHHDLWQGAQMQNFIDPMTTQDSLPTHEVSSVSAKQFKENSSSAIVQSHRPIVSPKSNIDSAEFHSIVDVSNA